MAVTRIKAATIAKACAEAFGVSVRDIYGPWRNPEIVAARHACFWLARRLSMVNAVQIGDQFGKHHTTVLDGIERVESRRATDADFAATLDAVEMTLKAAIESADARVRRLNEGFRDTDVIAAAERIARGDAVRNASNASTLEIAGLAHRVVALHAIAGATAALLDDIDALSDTAVAATVCGAMSPEDRAAARMLKRRIVHHTEILSGALAALGYSQEENSQHERTDTPAVA